MTEELIHRKAWACTVDQKHLQAESNNNVCEPCGEDAEPCVAKSEEWENPVSYAQYSVPREFVRWLQ